MYQLTFDPEAGTRSKVEVWRRERRREEEGKGARGDDRLLMVMWSENLVLCSVRRRFAASGAPDLHPSTRGEREGRQPISHFAAAGF